MEERHYSALCRAADSLASAAAGSGLATLDLVAIDLKDAWDALGEITGETATEEIISTVLVPFFHDIRLFKRRTANRGLGKHSFKFFQPVAVLPKPRRSCLFRSPRFHKL